MARTGGLLNLPRDCHIAMLQRGEPPSAFFSHYSSARNWSSALTKFPLLEEPGSKADATARLINWLKVDTEMKSITAGIAAFRLQQLHQRFDAAKLASAEFEELSRTVEACTRQGENENEMPD